MFGYRLVDDRALRQRKEDERAAARVRWPFITTLDLSMIDNDTQLATLVKDRSGASKIAAQLDVADWLKGYTSRVNNAVEVPLAVSPGTSISPDRPRTFAYTKV